MANGVLRTPKDAAGCSLKEAVELNEARQEAVDMGWENEEPTPQYTDEWEEF